MTQHRIDLLPDGSFECGEDQILQIKAFDTISFYLDSKYNQIFRPMLLTGYPRKKQGNKITYPDCQEITEEVTLQDPLLSQKYNVFEGSFNKEYQWQCDIQIGDFNGTFFCQCIFVNYRDNQSNPLTLNIKKFAKPQFIMIQPRIQINNQPVLLEELVMQTVLPYSLGPIENWEQKLQSQTNLGYNGFHFLPLNELGYSKSMYALKDQLVLNPDLIPNNDYNKLETFIKQVENQMGALSFTDIILNHTSCDSEWILDIPDAVYNERNTPNLTSAIELDEQIQFFSDKLSQCQIKEYSKGNLIENEEDLDSVLQIMRVYVFDKLQLQEYFEFDMNQVLNSFRQQLLIKKIKLPERKCDIQDDDTDFFSDDSSQKLFQIIESSYSNCGVERRQGVQIHLSKLMKEIIKNQYSYSYQCIEEALSQLFQKLQTEGKSIANICLDNIKSYIMKNKLQKNQTFKVGYAPDSLVPRYFTKLKNGKYAANNGYIEGDSKLEDLTESPNLFYLKRQVNIWGDLIKIRYGKNKRSCPQVWKRMRNYIRQMARVFHGFRLDNAHYIPLHVGEYFMRKARNVNKNIIVFAELFTNCQVKDATFCKRFGINALVRETINNSNTEQSIKQLIYYGGRGMNIIGSLEPMHQIDLWTRKDKTVLMPSYPSNIVYDQSHDNDSYLKKYGIKQAMANIALHSFGNFFQGTIRGYDELVSQKLSVVDERRCYPDQVQGKQQWIYLENQKIGILYKADRWYNQVEIRGSWDNWQNGINLINIGDNTYTGILTVPQDLQNFEYKYIVDGNWVTDPQRKHQNGNNLYQVENKHDNRTKIYKNLSQIRRILNVYAKKLAQKYPESSVSSHQNDVVSIIRQSKNKTKAYFMVSRLAFNKESKSEINLRIECPGVIDDLKEIFYILDDNIEYTQGEEKKFIQTGECNIFRTSNYRQFMEVYRDDNVKKSIIHFHHMPPGIVFIIKCTLALDQLQAINKLNEIFKDPNSQDIAKKFANLSPIDINHLLYKCEAEEENQYGKSTYQVPGANYLPFAGFAGLFHEVMHSSKHNMLKTKLFDNIREGDWLMDYLQKRIDDYGGNLKEVEEFTRQCFELMKKIQRHNIPYYFCKFIRIIRIHCLNNILARVKLPFGKTLQSRISKTMLMASYQFLSRYKITQDFRETQILSISSGLPKFSVDPNRMHGRDVFMSMKGNLLVPGLYAEAKEMILYFGSYLRHGLIPHNLNHKGKPRYNARDVCWWFIKGVQDYIEFTQDYSILQQKVEMKFQSNDQDAHQNRISLGLKKFMLIQDIIQDIFQSHMSGIKFIEWDAGKYLDPDMDSLGFHINLCYDEKTGFITGGNAKNALTWMNVIGSSQKGGNRGYPASPRDGAPIEITSLLYNCLEFASELNKQSKYPKEGVMKKNKELFTFEEWSEQILDNFDNYYCVPANKSKTLGQVNSCNGNQKSKNKLKRRKYGFYKDTIMSSNEEQEYQLRPNVCIAISISPQLFMNQHNKDIKKWTLQYLASVELFLVEPQSLGVKTLEPEDKLYQGVYDEGVDSYQYKSANGFNLHNGMEWVFLYGYFLKAMMFMNLESVYNNQRIMAYLAYHKQYLSKNMWQSFPGCTNKNGQENPKACNSRMISVAQIQEVCYELYNNDYQAEMNDQVSDARWRQSSRDYKRMWHRKTSSNPGSSNNLQYQSNSNSTQLQQLQQQYQQQQQNSQFTRTTKKYNSTITAVKH